MFYQDLCHCGVTGNGVAFGSSSGTYHFNVLIPSGSTIKKAFLISERYDYAYDTITVKLNGVNYTFSNSTIVANGFQSFHDAIQQYLHSSIHIINITNEINPSISNYTLYIPPQGITAKGYYICFYLYIEYKNATLPFTNTVLFFNNQDVSPLTHYHLSLNTINNLYPVGLEVLTSSFCNITFDGSYVQVDADTIGLIGGKDCTNLLSACGSPIPNFAYYNDSLFGLCDDTPDSLMGGPDATADIKSYIANMDTSVDVYFKYQSNAGPYTNPIAAVILNYVTGCDTFHTTLSSDTAICAGDSAQLYATGGTSTGSVPAYLWQPSYGLSCDTCANPIASPDSSVTYTVRIYHNDSCSKVLPVRVLVHRIQPKITLTPATCGDSNGTVTFTASNAAQYYLGNQHNTSGIFNNFPSGTYPAHITDSIGCQWQDTLDIGYTYPGYFVFFSINPSNGGKAPLTIHGIGQRTNANVYYWLINGDSIPGSMINYTFDSAGTYQVQLIACHDSYPCCDTVSKSITVLPNTETVVTIPNVFTPNGDGINDDFIVKMKNVKSGSMQIYNRWGTAMKQTSMQQADAAHNLTLQWNGKTAKDKSCSAGTYYYVVTYTTPDGKTKTVKGYVTLLR